MRLLSRSGARVAMRSAVLPPLLLLCSTAATAQEAAAACSGAGVARVTVAINEQCCGSDDAACSSGTPTSCDAGCAGVFMPFVRDCPEVALRFASVVALCEATVGAAKGGRRRVNWFTNGGAWPVGVDGLDLAGWVGAHRDAITGVFPCCSSWSALPNGTFVSSMDSTAEISRLGLSVIPTGHFSVDWVMSEAWMRPGALASAVALVETRGWDGLAIGAKTSAVFPSPFPQHKTTSIDAKTQARDKRESESSSKRGPFSSQTMKITHQRCHPGCLLRLRTCSGTSPLRLATSGRHLLSTWHPIGRATLAALST